MKKASAIRIAALAILAGAAGAVLTFVPVTEHLTDFLSWVRNIGPWGPVFLAVAYVPAALFFLPGSLLTLGSGFAFGVLAGTVAVSVGSTVGAALAFLAGRTLSRDFVESKVASNPRFVAIDRAVGREGFKIVLLTRLSPVFPYNLLNYAFGLTKVSFRDYVLASWIGMLPGTLMYVYLGSAVKSLADLAAGNVEGGLGQKILFTLGLMATVMVTSVVTRVARRSLEETLPPRERSETVALEGKANA
ncbi:MAG: TVP38/TMEM64 family protein [Acidobacteriota bacterium]